MIAAGGLENLGLLILNLALIRVFGAADHGRFVYYLSVISVIRLVFDAGIGASMVKRIGEGRDSASRILARGISLTALLNLPFLALICMRPGLFVDSGGDLFRFFALWLAFMMVQNLAVSAFNGLQAMRLTFCVSLLYETGKLGSVAWLVICRPGFETWTRGFNLALFACGSAVAALLWWKMRSARAGSGEAGREEPLSSTLGLALMLWAPTAAIAAAAHAMPIAIKLGLGAREVSYYNALVSWSLLAAVALTPAANAFFAWCSSRASGAPAETREVEREYFRLIGAGALGIALLLLAGKDLLLRFYGPEYLGYRAVFGIFVLAQLAEYPRFFTTPLLSGGAHAKPAMLLELGRVVAVLASALIAMAIRPGLVSVAIAVLGSQLAFGFIRLLHVRKHLAFSPMPGFLRILGAGIAGALLAAMPWHPAVKCLALLALFAGCAGAKVSDIGRAARHLGWR